MARKKQTAEAAADQNIADQTGGWDEPTEEPAATEDLDALMDSAGEPDPSPEPEQAPEEAPIPEEDLHAGLEDPVTDETPAPEEEVPPPPTPTQIDTPAPAPSEGVKGPQINRTAIDPEESKYASRLERARKAGTLGTPGWIHANKLIAANPKHPPQRETTVMGKIYAVAKRHGPLKGAELVEKILAETDFSDNPSRYTRGKGTLAAWVEDYISGMMRPRYFSLIEHTPEPSE